MKKIITLSITSLLFFGCAGIRQTPDTFSIHAESLRILGRSIPRDSQVAARELIPENAVVTTVQSTPADWDSFWGVIMNIISIDYTQLNGMKQ